MRQLEFPENIQAIVGGKEYSLDNAVLKIWPESEETNGEYASAIEVSNTIWIFKRYT